MSSNVENDRSNLGVIQDHEIKLKSGRTFQKSEEWNGKKLLSISDVKQLWKEVHGAESLREMESKSRRKVYLHELLMDSEVLIPKLEIPDRNPELEKRVAALRNSLAEREYQRMTQNVNSSSRLNYNPEDSIGFQMKQMNSALIAVFQFVISVACAFFFGFAGVELFVGGLQLPVRLLLGITIALVVGCAELYFLVLNVAQSEEALALKPLSSQSQASQTVQLKSPKDSSHKLKTL